MLGEPDPGYARRTVHGRRGDLWGCGVSTFPGKAKSRHTRLHMVTNCLTLRSHMPPLHAASRQEDIISIWNKTASDQGTTARIRDTLRRVLNLPPNTIMEYKTHTDSIKYVCLLLFYFLLQLFFLFSSFHKPACSHTFSNQRGNERVHLHVAFLMACF